MTTFRSQFEVRQPIESVAEFHRKASSMAAITPPPVIVQMKAAPTTLGEGDTMDFTLWLGPIPVHWLARIESVSSTGFVDRQLEGPFDQWVHRHSFQATGASTTQVTDEIDLAIRRHPLWTPIGLLMRLSLPFLFAYRGWKTRRLLESGSGA